MPNHDGTGPRGQGPRTGRGLGKCTGGKATGQAPRDGQGNGRGQGRELEFDEKNSNPQK